jgi:SNF2 family DNA or RNA helicase
MICVDIASSLDELEIRLYASSNCNFESLTNFVASMISSRFIASRGIWIIHVHEFRYLKEYADLNGIHQRDASDEALDRIVAWTKKIQFEISLKEGALGPLELSSHIKTLLYPDQQVGVQYLMHRRKSLLADSMGVGKTIQSIATFAKLKEQGLVRNALVVCINTVKFGWEKEIRKHSVLSAQVVPNGTAAILAALERYRESPVDFLIIHYDAIAKSVKKNFGFEHKQDLDNVVIRSLLQNHFDIVFLDEAHLLKNTTTRRYKCLNYLLSRIQPHDR